MGESIKDKLKAGLSKFEDKVRSDFNADPVLNTSGESQDEDIKNPIERAGRRAVRVVGKAVQDKLNARQKAREEEVAPITLPKTKKPLGSGRN